MPRYGGYGGYAQPQDLMQGAGGNPFYNPYSSKPNWGGGMQGISQIVQQLAMMKKMKKQEEEEAIEKEWTKGMKEYEANQTQQRIDLARKEIEEQQRQSETKTLQEAMEKRQRAQEAAVKVGTGEWTMQGSNKYISTGKEPESRPVLTRDQKEWIKKTYKVKEIDLLRQTIPLDQLQEMVDRYNKIHMPEPGKEYQPTEWDKKKTDITALVKSGKMTPEQGYKALYGVEFGGEKQDITKTAPARQANQSTVGSFYSNNTWINNPGEIRKHMNKMGYLKDDKYTRPIEGPDITIDMPAYYNIAKANIRDEVATPKDKEVVEKADKTAEKFFKELKSRKPKKRELLALFANNPEIDMNVLLMLAEIYR